MSAWLPLIRFQHTAARRRLSITGGIIRPRTRVSTHSRPKAAERDEREIKAEAWGFNTQPPEGG